MRMLMLLGLGAAGCLSSFVPLYDHQQQEPAMQTPQDPAPQDPLPNNASSDMGPSPDLAPVTQSVQVEGEAAALTAEFVTADDANASGGKYLLAPLASTTGKAVFTLVIPATAKYVVWGRVIAPTDANNSFHVSADADTIDNDATDDVSTIWDLPVSLTWTWVKLNIRKAALPNADVTLDLTAGTHTLYVNFREAGVQLDRLIVTSDTALTPTN